MKHERPGLEQFLKDILPFFYRRRFTYVDVGAFKGDVFEKVLASGLDIGEAHLFEPNPVALESAKARRLNGFKGHSVNYYNLAVGAESRRVSMHRAKTMTRIVGEAGPALGGAETLFEVDCTTLDAVAHLFTEKRISLLKIDVEGHEADVLAGAHELLSQQRVDCLYVEAGMNPDGVQQCYYRRIEDILLAHGYGSFGIYEQHHEWLEDSPLLRRVNVAFLSKRFAQANPSRVTRELFEANSRLGQLDDELSTARRAAETAEAEKRRWQLQHEAAERQASEAAALQRARAADQQRRLAQLEARLESLSAEAAETQTQLKNATLLHRESSIRAARATQEKSELMAQLREFHSRSLDAWKAAAKAQGRLAALRARTPFRAVRAVRANAGSVEGWLRMPVAVWREITSASAQPAALAMVEAKPAHAFEPGKSSLSLPLTVKPQRLTLSLGDETRFITARALFGSSSKSVSVHVAVSASSGAERVRRIGDVAGPAADIGDPSAVRRKLQVLAGVPTLLLELSGPDPRVEIELSRPQGDFCLLILESSQAAAPPSASPRRITAAANDPVPPGHSAAELEKKLWGGYAVDASIALERIRRDTHAPAAEREAAAWTLARWFYAHDDPGRALQILDDAGFDTGKPQNRVQMARVQCLLAIGQWRRADDLVKAGLRGVKALDFKLLRSTLVRLRAIDDGSTPLQADALRLEALNEVLAAGDLAPLRLREASQPLSLANITAQAQPGSQQQTSKVSVVVPAFNAAASIDYVITSLLEQTWRHLEVIVVDDCSSDDTVARVQHRAAGDSRVRLIRNVENLGAYRTRNVGAAASTGELLTVHDSDDWSHPQKIERQVAALLAQPAAVAIVSSWVRVDAALGIVGPWLPKGTLYDVNFSSLLFRRSVIETIGLWDEVQVSGDAEYYFRMRSVYGEDAIHKLPQTQLLSFSLTRPDSLTRAKATHISTLLHGLRWNYRDAFCHWHARLRQDDSLLPLESGTARRRFPVPIGNSVRRAAQYRYDLVVIADLAMRGGAFVSTLNYIIAAARSGMTVAVFHWRKYSLAAATPLQPRLYEACTLHGIDILSPGDNVVADTVLFGYPVILAHQIDPMPKIDAGRVLVIVNQFASRLTNGQDVQYDPLDLRKRVLALFGTEGLWIPISDGVKRLMTADKRYLPPYATPWNPMIDAQAWCAEDLRWRGGGRGRPVVGRHGRDAYTKWPAAAADLRLAYGVGQDWDVRFLGGANHAIGLLGEKPANWTITPFDGVGAQDFLRDLDFYVHYPHELYIEEFGRAVMEAMAQGIPCVLPPVFAETFGDAASYAAPDQVAGVIAGLWRSQERYLEQARLGRTFVQERCDIRGFQQRLRLLVDSTQEHPASAEPALQSAVGA